MSEQDRIAAHAAAVKAWADRIAPVLADVDAARTLALSVVSLLLMQLAGMKLKAVADLLGRAIAVHTAGGRLLCAFEWCPVRDCTSHETTMASLRREAWALADRLFTRGPLPWTWKQRAPYEVAAVLTRALEAEDVLTRGTAGRAKCAACGGRGRVYGVNYGHALCPICHGSGWQPSEPVAPPLLALLLHDAHALLADLRAGPEELDKLVRKAVAGTPSPSQ